MRRSAEGRAPAPAHQTLADVIVDRDQVPGRRRAGDDLADFGGECRRHPLVGIDFEDPVAAAGVDPGMAARPLALPAAFDQAIGKRPGDLARAVAAAVEDDDDLVGKAEPAKTIGELTLPRHATTTRAESSAARSGHAAALATAPHSRRAAASAASTESPSINVSVVRWSKPGPNIVSGGSAERTKAARGPQGAYWRLGLGPNRPKRRRAATPQRCASARCRCR